MKPPRGDGKCGSRYRVLIGRWKISGIRHCTKPRGHKGNCGRRNAESMKTAHKILITSVLTIACVAAVWVCGWIAHLAESNWADVPAFMTCLLVTGGVVAALIRIWER